MNKIKITAISDNQTKYSQLLEFIVNNIRRGIYADGSMLPSESELCKLGNVSRATVRKTMEILFERNLIIKHQGKRSIVNTSVLKNKVSPMRFAWISREPLDHIMPVYLEIYNALQRYMIGVNANLIFLQMLNPQEEEWLLSMMDSFDGFFLAGLRPSTLIEPLNQKLYETPNTIEIDDIGESPATYTICSDNYLAGKMCGNYLFDNGCCNTVVFISDRNIYYHGFHERVRGIIDSFTEHKTALELQYYRSVDSVDNLRRQAVELLKYNDKIDTVWAVTDTDAIKIRKVLEDVSGRGKNSFRSIGIDGYMERIKNEVCHTSIKHPVESIARIAFQTMINLMTGIFPDNNIRHLAPDIIPWKI